MAIDFAKTFGVGSVNASTSNTTTSKPKASFWLNVGYLTDQVDKDGEPRFVSLASGIALDTMETLATTSRDTTFGMFQAARNELRDQLITGAKTLKPGEATYIGLDQPLQIQIRRVSEEVAAPVAEGVNPFVRKLSFSVPAAA